MLQEKWLKIPNYENYEASNLGRIRSLDRDVFNGVGYYLKTGRVLKNTLYGNGYCYVTLSNNGNEKKKKKKVSQLVAMTFLNHTPCGYKIVVDHINNIKTDDRLDNLQLLTNRQNSTKDQKNMYSNYTGVTYHKNRKNWQSAIYINGKNKYLGSYKTELEASKAYQNEIDKL
jgi:hypothetical protein